ncbi:uncharacterized protein LOC123300509 [Chrysoperla carnea]|uniref:uncharacterized protein LOC123300509 n=1 Tax=Chrysoperla carnea TaxID=189513 RepID=UPI001D08C217|nr:uncharacterized protein LOC123300509 [Chrysoperla carnea]
MVPLKIFTIITLQIIVVSTISPLETNYGLLGELDPLKDTFGQETPSHALFIRDDFLKNIKKRQTNGHKKDESADVMVQNILKWLQNIYGQNNRRVRQGAREYLPPLNTEKPRPFGGPYEPSGAVRPTPSFPSGPSGSSPSPNYGAPSPAPTQGTYASSSTGPLQVDLGGSIQPGGTAETGANSNNNDLYSTAGSPSGGDSNYIQPTYTPEGTQVSPTQLPPDDDINHPPHIHAIDVECSKEQMTVNIEFNRPYDGIIYSKGYFSDPACRYVTENSGQTKFTFTLTINQCGTEFISAFETEGQSYLENVLVLQNEAGIQEVWDSIKTVRCLWEGNVNQALSVALSVGMLSQEVVTFSGDTAMARLDIQVGRGPFAPAANGLVKIGETMTLVVSVTGDPDFDIQVKDCIAKDESGQNQISLTDSNGCILKPKLFGAFQKTRDTQNTGASIIAYAFFNAFKFPDVMDLTLECNIELCKTDCQVCPNPDQKLEPGKKRRRRSVNPTNIASQHSLLKYHRVKRSENSTDEIIAEPVKLKHKFQVIAPEEILSDRFEEVLKEESQKYDSICMSTHGFLFSFVSLVALLILSAVFSATIWLRYQRLKMKY